MTVSGVDVTRAYKKRAPGFAFLLGRIPIPGDWATQGACRDWPLEWWFPTRGFASEKTARARDICATCPVQAECADYALDHYQLIGLWGGLDAKQRRTARRHRRAS